jgi:hypothetical protein
MSICRRCIVVQDIQQYSHALQAALLPFSLWPLPLLLLLCHAGCSGLVPAPSTGVQLHEHSGAAHSIQSCKQLTSEQQQQQQQLL